MIEVTGLRGVRTSIALESAAYTLRNQVPVGSRGVPVEPSDPQRVYIDPTIDPVSAVGIESVDRAKAGRYTGVPLVSLCGRTDEAS